MSDLQDLYQQLILDHNRRPRNCRPLDCPDRQCNGFNPLCGDRVTIYLKLNGDLIEDATFSGSGCAISTASASLMTEVLKGKTLDQARELFGKFRRLVTDGAPEAEALELGKLGVFSGVSNYPARVKCATLAWHTMKSAVDNAPETVSTE